jgi:16S rRNA (cytosine967-C5)-methyltransferase
VLRRVETRGAFASHALRAGLDRSPAADDERERSLATELVYGVLRRRAQLDKAIGAAANKRLKDLDPKLHDVLRLAAYQLAFLDRVPEHAAVSEAVDQARQRRGERGAKLANAILRRLAALPRDHRVPAPPPLERDPVGHLAEAASLPRAIAERFIRDLGVDEALRYAAASLERAPLTLRANLRTTTRQALAKEVGGEPGEHPLSVHLPARAGALPGDVLAVVEGRATPQDEGSMRIVDLLDPQRGERVLDVCAAPGGKTTHIAERMDDQGQVIACDRTPEKLKLVAQAALRLHLRSVQVAELLPETGAEFDRVLVDAPCSGLGTLRRHPELRWRYRAEDVERLTPIQRTVFLAGAARTRPGGVLVYSVCTITEAEGQRILESKPDDFAVEELLRTAPYQPGAPDGFFAVKLRRKGP